MLPDFNNEVAVVTGAGSGIGLALALACGAAGMKVAATNINPEGLGAARAALSERGIPHIVARHDVTSTVAWVRSGRPGDC
jgi:NAD(P)-dependent dehydrogenase (short-subunit alcohol dehydrogenase family)